MVRKFAIACAVLDVAATRFRCQPLSIQGMTGLNVAVASRQ
jgi:hypothetical protein